MECFSELTTGAIRRTSMSCFKKSAQAAVLLLAAVLPAVAAESWLKISSGSFDLYTSAGEKNGRATLLHFEQVRAFFLKASPVKKTSDSPVRIIQFGSLKQFQPYALRSFSPAYFLGLPGRDYIVIGDPGLDMAVSTHEYMHLVIARSGLKIPAWLHEGWADVYSTLHPMGKETAIGDLLPGRMAELNSKLWLDFETLTLVDHRSAEYNEAERAGIFYAESWALAHMLYLAQDYQGNFGKFVMALNKGKTAAEACQIAWGRGPEKVFADLRSYFGRKQLYGRAFDLRLSTDAVSFASVTVADFDARLMLADLLGASNKPDQAQRAYDELEKEHPERADLARSMGYLAGQRGDRANARKYFERAFESGESDPLMLLQLAVMARQAGQPVAKTLAMLERAVKVKPDYPDALVQLGLTRLEMRDFTGAIRDLMRIPAITAERAAAVYCALGYARLETGDPDEARLDVETCGIWARTDGERAETQRMSRLIAARREPGAGVYKGEKRLQLAGVAIAVECSSGSRRLIMQTGERQVQLELPDLAAVELKPVRGGKLELGCGAKMAVPTGVEFAAPRSAMEKSAGTVRLLLY